MFDGKIVHACVQSRAAYDRVKAHVDPKEFTPTGQLWWKLVVEWYNVDPAASGIDPLLLRDRATRAAGRNAGMALDWWDAVQHEACPSADNVALEVLALKKEIAWRKLTAAMEGERDDATLRPLIDEYYELAISTSLGKRSTVKRGTRIEDLDEQLSAENRIRLWPAALQAKTGGATEGDHIVVFGRPEVGKSLLAINMVAGWLKDGHGVLYVGNEENIDKTQNRLRANLSGIQVDDIPKWKDEVNRRCLARGWNHLNAVHLFPGSAAEISELIEECKPRCLVVDQLRNLHSNTGQSRGGTKAQRLDDIACDVRQLGAKYGLTVLSVGQAHAQEHGRDKVWLDMDDFDESRTGVPGQADLMIGMGMDATLAAHNQRALSLPKNKLSGNHEGFVVNIDPKRSRIQ